VSWWLAQGGLRPVVLAGGYKAFREWALNQAYAPIPVSIPAGGAEGAGAVANGNAGSRGAVGALAFRGGGPRICIVAGRTGSGKTRVLTALTARGEQVEPGAAHATPCFRRAQVNLATQAAEASQGAERTRARVMPA